MLQIWSEAVGCFYVWELIKKSNNDKKEGAKIFGSLKTSSEDVLQLTAVFSSLVLYYSLLYTLPPKKQRGKYPFSTSCIPVQSIEHTQIIYSNLHRGEVASLRELWWKEAAGIHASWGPCFSQCWRPDLGNYLLSWETELGWTKNIQHYFRHLLARDIISTMAEKILSIHPEATSVE